MTTAVASIPTLSRAEAYELARTEYARFTDMLRALDEQDWTKPTDCPLWDVRAIAGHSVGMMSDFTSMGALMRRLRKAGKVAKATEVEQIDAMTSGQVADHAAMSSTELIARAAENGPRAARWRTSTPALLRRLPMPQNVDGVMETWRAGYLFDTILTRDPWMHRIDISRATDRELVLTPEHDGRIVADVVAEWARRHDQPFSLVLTGPAGGEFCSGSSSVEAPPLTMGAIEFCRTLSGRVRGTGLLAQQVPF